MAVGLHAAQRHIAETLEKDINGEDEQEEDVGHGARVSGIDRLRLLPTSQQSCFLKPVGKSLLSLSVQSQLVAK